MVSGYRRLAVSEWLLEDGYFTPTLGGRPPSTGPSFTNALFVLSLSISLSLSLCAFLWDLSGLD